MPAILAFLALICVAYQNLLDASFGRLSLIATVLIMMMAAIYDLLFWQGAPTGRCAVRTSWRLAVEGRPYPPAICLDEGPIRPGLFPFRVLRRQDSDTPKKSQF